jgi:DNA-binding MarR family transcriptional regulator
MTDVDTALDRTLELAVLVNEDMDRALAADGLTRSRAHVLWELHHRGPVPQRTLATALQVSARNITGMVDALVATGFVTRQPHPTDRRATLVTPTEHGRRTAAALARDRHELAVALFSDLPPDRLATFAEVLDLVLVRFRQLGDSSAVR